MQPVRPDQLDPGDLPMDFGRYVLRSVLGEGGMARVFQATLRGTEGFTKEVALKVVRHAALDDTARAQLVAEARIGGLLGHPHVVHTLDLEEIDDTLVIAMEWVVGVSGHELLRRVGPLPPATVLEIARQACRGLTHAHTLRRDGGALGLVHRDLKPGNLLVSQDGTVKVADFGIAVAHGIADGRQVMGTPAYMAPEQIEGGGLGPTADLFAMGVVISALALGRSPFARHSAAASVAAIRRLPETLAEARLSHQLDERLAGLGAVVGRCLRVEPAERWATAAALEQALAALVPAAPPGPPLDALVRRVQGAAADAVRPDSAVTTAYTVVATNVMPARDRFVGREAELTELSERLSLGRLVTVTGPAGTGKSRLAAQWATAHGQRFAQGGVWRVALDGLSTAEALCTKVIMTLGLQDVSPADLGEALAARGPMLLVLDPFEGLVPFAEPTVGAWLKRARQLHVLVVSRERLRIPSEGVLSLEPLGTEDAVALFYARVGDRSPALLDDPTGRERVHTLVERLEGVPLALERAAAQMPQTTLKRLLRRRADVATRASLEASWGGLSAAEQATFAQLSVFAGGFTMADAEAVVYLDPEGPWVVFAVEALVDKSLVREVSMPDLGRQRFAMYDSIRRFAAAKLRGLGPDAERQLRDRVVARLAARASAAVFDGVERRWVRATLELPNLRSAMAWAQIAGDFDAAAVLTHLVSRILARQGEITGALEAVERLLEAGDTGPWRGLLHLDSARLLREQGQLPAADKALGAAARVGSGERAAEVEVERAAVALDAGQLASAASRAHTVVVGDAPPAIAARAHLVRAWALLDSDAPGARMSVEVAGVLLERAASAELTSDHNVCLAAVEHAAGAEHAALQAVDDALRIGRRLGDARRVGRAARWRGLLLAALGRQADSDDALSLALTQADDCRDRVGEARAWWALASAAASRGDLAMAARGYRSAHALLAESGRRRDCALVEVASAELRALEGDLYAALSDLKSSVERLESLDAVGALALALAVRAMVAAELGSPNAHLDLARATELVRPAGLRLQAEVAVRGVWVLRWGGDDAATRVAAAGARRVLCELEDARESGLWVMWADAMHAIER